MSPADVTLLSDNLNTHTKGWFYGAFAPDQAREQVRGLTIWLVIGTR